MSEQVALVQVRLVGVPLPLRARSVEHGQDLLRKLALVQIAAGQPDTRSVPQRLLDVADELGTTYGSFTAGPTAEMDAALDRGVETMDLTYEVPAHARAFIHQVVEVLKDAEEFCRAGKYLLTLAAPPDVAAYRSWIFGKFDRQIVGGSPISWADARQASNSRCDGHLQDRAGAPDA
ncbi:hypothetical protein [uncultured Cellulomonas sp.]|uniref:hypothetical protein n=1 Tax=uncultured Cellulomonas sp. TaxID=189682 RepID=UPI00260A5EFF|nr:hypothetical protein [uncultured Cellulomonas sp.]